MEPRDVVPTTNTTTDGGGIIKTPRSSRPGSSSSGSRHHHHHTRKPSNPDVLLDSLGLHDLDAERTERDVQELLRKHSSLGGGITTTATTSVLPTLNERMSNDSVNDGSVKDLHFIAKTNKKSDDHTILLSGGEGGTSGTSPVMKDLIILEEEEAEEEETADENDR
jgi:hypothetical protein